MRHWAALAILLVLLAPPPAGAGPDDDVVEASLAWEAGPLYHPRAMFLPLGPEVPQGIKAPSGVEAEHFARIRWGEGRGLAFALDTAAGGADLWVDRDLDARFDDEAVERLVWADRGVAATREVEVAVVYDDQEARVTLRLLRAAVWDANRVRIIPLVHRFGFVELEGRLRAVALTDGNADLRFGESEHDALFLDLDGDGELDLRAEGGERIVSGEAFRLGEGGWTAEVPKVSGALVRFRRTQTAPPPRPIVWKAVGLPTPGYRPSPPTEPLEAILARIEAERDLPYAQRYAAIALLGRVGTSEAFEALDRLVRNDADRSARAAAVRAMGSAAYVEPGGDRVVALTEDSDTNVATAAVDALHRMDHPGRERVYRRLLADAPAVVVGRAAKNLAYLGTPEALDAVARAWRKTSDGPARYAIYQGLRATDGGPAPEVAREAARDAYAPLCAMALQDLRVLDPAGVLALARDAATVRPVNATLGRAVIDVLATCGDGESVEILLDLAPDLPANLEAHLEDRLSPLRGSEAVDALVEGLGDTRPAVRLLAARTLAQVVRPAVTEGLLRRVRREKDDDVLAALLEALGDHGDAEATSVLLKKARTRNDAVRRAAIRALARVGLADARVRKALLKRLDARDWEDRVLAVDAIAASGDERLAAKLAEPLEDDVWQVRLAAAQAAGALRSAEPLEALIERLEAEDNPRVKDAVARALFLITHRPFYDEAAVWREWWEGARASGYVPPKEPPVEKPHQQGHTGPGFYGIPLNSNRVVFVIDQSGSMSAADGSEGERTRLETALREVRGAVDQMGDRDRANVILFHSTVHPWHEALQRLTKRNRRDLVEHLDHQKPTGGTNLYDALETALRMEDVDTVFLLSDGAPGLGRYVAKDDILRAVRRLNQTRRVRIHGVAVGMHSDLLRELAAQSGGQYIQR